MFLRANFRRANFDSRRNAFYGNVKANTALATFARYALGFAKKIPNLEKPCFGPAILSASASHTGILQASPNKRCWFRHSLRRGFAETLRCAIFNSHLKTAWKTVSFQSFIKSDQLQIIRH